MNDIISATYSPIDFEGKSVFIPLVVTMGIIIVILTISVLIMFFRRKKPSTNVLENRSEGTLQVQMDQPQQKQG